MKKLLSVLLLFSLLFVGSAFSENDIRLGGLKGPTTMGLVKLIEDNESGNLTQKYDFTMAVSADELVPKFINGEMDIIAVPTNLASVLYNKTNGGAKLLGIGATGVLYIVQKGGEKISTLKDLKGKTLYATGKGTTPEMALNYLLDKEGLKLGEDVKVTWLSEPTEAIAKFALDEEALALLPEPFVTVAKTKVEGLESVISLDEEWKRLGDGSMLTTACVVARKDFVESNPEKVEQFLKDFFSSVEYVNANLDEAAKLVEKNGIVKAPIAKKAIPFCNLTALTKDDMKLAAEGYIKVLFDQNPKSVGGSLPEDDFYYGVK
ncbi:MAG: ABC transporter substrate-binding protein [Eubacteriales bacterium]|nr:ABC transporter substrate-binding protein [Eubacteriales bacterium]